MGAEPPGNLQLPNSGPVLYAETTNISRMGVFHEASFLPRVVVGQMTEWM